MQNLPTSSNRRMHTAYNIDLPALKVAFLDVGQGDTIIISCSETHEAVVVDCIDAEAVLHYLEQEKIQYLRGVIITHLHADHYRSVADLLENDRLVPGLQMCEVLVYNKFFNRRDWGKLREDQDMHSSNPNSSAFDVKPLRAIRRWAEKHKLQCSDLKVGARTIIFRGTMANSIKFLHPYYVDYSQLEAKGLNNTSAVMRVAGPNSSALLTGDLEPTGWRSLLENLKNNPDNPDIQSDILKFPHHGGAWSASDTESLLNIVQPSIVVLSVGTNGERYGHPNKEVFEVLSSPSYSHIRILCTQATNQCHGSVIDQRDSIIQRLDLAARDRDQERLGSKYGCPCAGTVIIELGETASVIQPSEMFHRDEIIRPHFSKPQCVLQ